MKQRERTKVGEGCFLGRPQLNGNGSRKGISIIQCGSHGKGGLPEGKGMCHQRVMKNIRRTKMEKMLLDLTVRRSQGIFL